MGLDHELQRKCEKKKNYGKFVLQYLKDNI